MGSTISATELARSTREVLDMVLHAGTTVGIERNNVLIAQLIPPKRVMTASQALEGLNLPMLTPVQANAWLWESRAGNFDDEVRDPWE